MSKDLLSSKKNVLTVAGIVLGSSLLFFAAQVLAVAIVLIALQLFGKSSKDVDALISKNINIQFATLVLVAVISVYLIYKVLTYLKKSPKKFLLLDHFPTARQLGEALVVYGLYFLTLIVTVMLINGINTIFSPGNPIIDTDQAQDLGIGSVHGWSLVAAFMMLVVIPPIYEEIIFRGYLFNSLKKFSHIFVAGALTSILFGLAHLEFSNLNWIAAIDTLIFSGFLIYISQKHKSLYSAMLLHSLKNMVAFYVLFVR